MQERLRGHKMSDLISYNSETGILTWKARTYEMFSHTSDNRRFCDFWNRCNAGKEALTSTNKDGYKSGAVWGSYISAHRAAWEIHYGLEPEMDIDHINLDKSDNRIENLRLASRTENNSNKTIQKNNTSGHKGVFWAADRKRWRVLIRLNKKLHNIGNFTCFDSAVAAHEAAIIKLHGNFARIE